MLRTVLLYFSDAPWARSLVTNLGLARRIARRFVSGETLEEALTVVQNLNAQGLLVTLDYLGESVASETDARQAGQQYNELLNAIAERQLQATVSLKLTQLGLNVDKALCLQNMRDILTLAGQTGNHVTIDMESSAYTDVTLDIFRTLLVDDARQNVGTVIQSYLYRSAEDMQSLKADGAFVRLCKGAYKEPPDRGFPQKADVDANFVALMKDYLSDARQTGAYLGVATHDVAIIDTMRQYAADNAISNDSFEFQMLYGIRSDLQHELAAAGYTMRVYVPYGTQWYPYFMRRLAERPANLWFFIANFFR